MKYMPTFVLVLCAVQSSCQLPEAQPEVPPPPSATTDDAKSCQALVGAQLGSATIENAQWFKRGEPLLGLAQRTAFAIATKGKLQLDARADFCHITAKARPAPGSQITIGVWLPQPWNGKLLGNGGAGFNGWVAVAGLTSRELLGQGYAVVATDAGHDPTDSAKFAYDSPESLKDYGYRANHLGAEFAKSLIAAYYDKPIKHAYFQGCSNGGRDALMEAQRFPDDYDGIIAGAPAADFTGVMSKFVWTRQVVARAPKLGDKLKLLQSAVTAKCDALDGVKDGLLENPPSCAFDPAELQCKDGDGDNCLSAAEVDVARTLYHGPRSSDGTQLYPGQPVGAEGLHGGWDDWVVGKMPAGGEEFFRWVVYGDPKWDISRFDLVRDSALAKERVGPIVDATNPDLSAFMRRGGKLLMYHGWNDTAIPAGATQAYYMAMRKAVGPVADQQARLFMVPGLLHCSEGPGATMFDKIGEMDHWVESGIAPDRIVATQYDPPATSIVLPDAKMVRTRPLCPWPKVAHYKGSGSSDDAENFSCQ